jgi:hypothetical protein
MVWQCPDIVPGLIIGSILPVRIVPHTIRQKPSTKPNARRATRPTKALEMRTILITSLPYRIHRSLCPQHQRKTIQGQTDCPLQLEYCPNRFGMQTLSIPCGSAHFGCSFYVVVGVSRGQGLPSRCTRELLGMQGNTSIAGVDCSPRTRA